MTDAEKFKQAQDRYRAELLARARQRDEKIATLKSEFELLKEFTEAERRLTEAVRALREAPGMPETLKSLFANALADFKQTKSTVLNRALPVAERRSAMADFAGRYATMTTALKTTLEIK